MFSSALNIPLDKRLAKDPFDTGNIFRKASSRRLASLVRFHAHLEICLLRGAAPSKSPLKQVVLPRPSSIRRCLVQRRPLQTWGEDRVRSDLGRVAPCLPSRISDNSQLSNKLIHTHSSRLHNLFLILLFTMKETRQLGLL